MATAPSHAAQMRPLVLIVTTGMRGFRLAFAGGSYFETIGDFSTLEEATAARKAALAATQWVPA